MTAPGAQPPAGPQQAQADAAFLLSQLQVPPGSQQTAGEPAGGGAALAQPAQRPATPNLVDVTGWWIAPGSPDQVLAWIAQHRPAGSRLVERNATFTGGGDSSHVVFESFGWPASQTEESRAVVVEASERSDGSTALRADGQSIWVLQRSESERVPAGVRVLRVTVAPFEGRRPRPVLIRDVRKVRLVAALINGLPVVQPGVRVCPAVLGPRVLLSFRRRAHGPVIALAVADTSGCGDVSFDLHGVHQLPLSGAVGLVQAVSKTLRVPLTAQALLRRAP